MVVEWGEKPTKYGDFNGMYPAWWTNSLQLKLAIEIVDFPINSMVDLSIAMLVHQRVYWLVVDNDIPPVYILVITRLIIFSRWMCMILY